MTPPPQYPGGLPAKKGLPPLAWAGIGCGGLALLAVISGGLLVGTCAKNSSMTINGNSTLQLAFRKGMRELVVIAFGNSGQALVIQTTYKETK